jgi:hypothetical protein
MRIYICCYRVPSKTILICSQTPGIQVVRTSELKSYPASNRISLLRLPCCVYLHLIRVSLESAIKTSLSLLLSLLPQHQRLRLSSHCQLFDIVHQHRTPSHPFRLFVNATRQRYHIHHTSTKTQFLRLQQSWQTPLTGESHRIHNIVGHPLTHPSSGPPTTFRLMDLPNEIIKEICGRPELEKKDLRSLRLTSKHLCDFVLRRFARECFSKITVLMTRPSLRAFIELSQHPYFGSVVEQVNISPCFVPHSNATHIARPLPSEGSDSESIDLNQVVYSNKDIETVMAVLSRSRKELELRTDGSAERMLSVAFKAFAQREQRFQLQFCDNESNAVGAKDLIPDQLLGQDIIFNLDWKTTIERTIRVVTSHGCRVTGLLISESDRYESENDTSMGTDDVEQQLSSLCSHLTYLEVTFSHSDIDTTLDSVKRMVSAATNLNFLHLMKLGAWDSTTSTDVPEVLKCVASTSLETIEIAEFQAFEGELHEFLRRQRDTLRDLKLLSGCLLAGSCMSLIAWIKDNLPNLVSLELWEICGSTDHADCPEEDLKSYHIRRDEDMQLCLARILDGKYEKDVKVEEIDETGQVKVGNDGPEQVEVVDG